MDVKSQVEKEILEAAKLVFQEKGYRNTQMGDIAKLVGINRSNLHYYFRTKERLFQEVFSPIVELLVPKVCNIIDKDVPIYEKISKIIDEYILIFKENPYLPRFIVEESHRDLPHLLNAMRSLGLESFLDGIEKMLRTEIERGQLKQKSVSIFCTSFYTMITYPFVSKDIIYPLILNKDAEAFDSYLKEWKQIMLYSLFESKVA